MNKLKKFFFNKIEKDTRTSFTDLTTSFLLGAVKIFILLIINSIIIMLIMPKSSKEKYFVFFQIISITIFLSILIYILINRIPNQIKIIKNYIKSNKDKKQNDSKIMIKEKTINSESLNFDKFKGQIYFKNGKKDIHYTFEQLKIKGNLYTTDLIWFEGLKKWTIVNEINELSSIALSKPPLTEKEKYILSFKESIKPSLIFYVIFSIILGIATGFLERHQYITFIDEITNNCKQNIEREDEIKRKNQKFITELNQKNDFNLSENKIDFSSYSDMPSNEIYATNKDGSRFTRWRSVLAIRGTDQEQISYNHDSKFLFRPYQAIIEHANLSKKERENISLLLFNFVLSALVTNLLFLPILSLVYFFKIKSNYDLE
jgi:hypothetical protein